MKGTKEQIGVSYLKRGGLSISRKYKEYLEKIGKQQRNKWAKQRL